MAKNPETESTQTDDGNEYIDVVNKVWDERSDVAQARTALRDALDANEKRFSTESEAINDARIKLNEKFSAASAELNKRDKANREAHARANDAARKAFREATNGEYEERSYY